MILYRIQAAMVIFCTLSPGYFFWKVLSTCEGWGVKVFLIAFYLLICLVGRSAVKQLKREAQEKQ